MLCYGWLGLGSSHDVVAGPPTSSATPRLGPPVLDRWKRGSAKRTRLARSSKRMIYLWEDLSEGMFSLEATAVALHPTNKKIAYAGADGILYRSTNGGERWRPIVRFRGAGRALLQQISGSPDLRRLKERILEEKLEDLAAEVGEERAEELRDTLEREAEEEAERQLGNRSRRTGQVTGSGRFRRRIHRIVIPKTRPNWVAVATDAGYFLSKDAGKTFKHLYRGRSAGQGDVRVIRFDPKDPNRVWLGTRTGLWYTLNGGKRFYRNAGNIRAFEVREIRFDPNNPKHLYVATNRSLFFSTNRGNKFRRLWTSVSGTRRITGLAMLAGQPSQILLATGNGIYLSKDRKDFKRIPAAGIGSRNILYITTIKAHPNWVFAVNDQGVFVSKNRGRRFKQRREGMLSPNIRWLAVREDDPRETWAATDFGVLRWSKTVAGKFTPAQWRRFQKRLRAEPSPWQMAQAAMKYMMLPHRLKRLLARNAARGWMPQLNARALLVLDNDQSNLLLIEGTRPISILEGRNFLLEVSLNWNLGRLVLDDQQLRVSAEAINLRRKRQRIINRVVRLYHARKRLIMRLFVAPPRNVRTYTKKLVKIQEVTAYLDGLTGGYLYRTLKRRRLLQAQWGF